MSEEPPAGWTVWNEGGDGRLIWVYRPDVFDSDAFPAPCLPTLYVRRQSPGQRRRPGTGSGPSADWHVTLYLEPEVRVRDCDASEPRRADAIDAARAVARAFAAGEVDYRAAYQVPRDAYLDELDDLTGRDA
ncbi:MAG: DUF5820 family protein [Halobacteriaceae archaeon]